MSPLRLAKSTDAPVAGAVVEELPSWELDPLPLPGLSAAGVLLQAKTAVAKIVKAKTAANLRINVVVLEFAKFIRPLVKCQS